MFHTSFSKVDFRPRAKSATPSKEPATLIKPLSIAPAGDPAFYEAVVSEYPKPKTYPRHRHRVDQFRWTLQGDSPWRADRVVPPGRCVYIPAGTFYGPYVRPAGVELFAVQFTAASGEPFEARQLDETDAPPRNPFALTEPVEVDPAVMPARDHPAGGQVRPLIDLPGNDVEVSLRTLPADVTTTVSADRRTLVFVLGGRGQVHGPDTDPADRVLEQWDCLTLDPSEQAVVSARRSTSLLVIALPRIPAAH